MSLAQGRQLLVETNILRDVTTGATGATGVSPKFSDILTFSQPRGANSVYPCRGRG